MPGQKIRPALLSGVVTAAIGSTIAVLINFATSGSGGVLIWIAVAVLTVISGVVPHTPISGKKIGLICGVLVLVLVIASDGFSTSRDTPAADTPSRETTAPPKEPEPLRPLPGVREANPVNPDSIAVTTRLTAALRDSGVIPDDVSVEPSESSGDAAPLEFYASQGEFKAAAELRIGGRSTEVFIQAVWDGTNSFISECDAADANSACAETVAADGTQVKDVVTWDPATHVNVSEGVLVTTRDGAQVSVDESLPDGEDYELVLGGVRMTKIALLTAQNMADKS